MEEFTEYSETERQLVETQLDEEPSFLMQIIRGHFLLESKLNEMLLIVARNPEHVSASNAPRLDFYTKVFFLKVMAPKPPQKWFWTAIEKFNVVRNKAAHELESEKLDKAISEFVSYMKSNDDVFSSKIKPLVFISEEDLCVYALTSLYCCFTVYTRKLKELKKM